MFCQATFLSQYFAQLADYSASRYLIGFSGGKDSHVLLDSLCQLRDSGKLDTPLAAIHVNHQLNPEAEQWVKHCQAICDGYQVPLIIETVNAIPPAGSSIEAFAREQRYDLIEQYVAATVIFLSAHHQRDQAETFLLQLMRGAGLDGLRAMPVIKSLGAGRYLRPLLASSYEEICQYATQRQLQYIEDNSNDNLRFDRNYIRHEVLPTLTQRFPQAIRSIAQSAQWLAEIPEESPPKALFINSLNGQPLKAQKQQIRSYVKAKTGISLSQNQTQIIVDNHLNAAQDKQPQLVINQQYVVRRYDKQLIMTVVLPSQQQNDAVLAAKSISLGSNLDFPLGNLAWQAGEGLYQTQFNQLTLLPLTGSLRFHPHHRNHSSTVKKLLAEAGIAPWLRQHWFGLFSGDELVAIPNVGVAKKHYQKKENACIPQWIIKEKFVRL